MADLAPVLRVFVADDHAVVRQGLLALLGHQTDFAVVGATETAQELLQQCLPGAWDLLVLDLALSGANDLQLLSALREKNPQGKILIYTAQPEGPGAIRLLLAGADGYVTKSRSLDELLMAMRTIAKEGKYMSGVLAQLLLEAGPDGSLDPLHELSERELMVLRRFAAGERTTEIATSLSIAPSTVSSHLKSLKRKLNVASNAELVRFAVKQGLVSE
ncbi:MAG: response regulator transcription factor [Myxococcales bacterium]|nr:response regulator transcription factor [Myxococcales bacterium]